MRERAHYLSVVLGIALGAASACTTSAPQSPPAATSALQPSALPQASTASAVAASPTPGLSKQEVSFQSGNLTLSAAIYKPAGAGPFPAVVWNRGSEVDPEAQADLEALANIFVPAGYVLFVPVPEGEGKSQGQSVKGQLSQAQNSGGKAAAQKLFVQLMQGPALSDQLAGLSFLKTQPFVDTGKLVVAGCGWGGVQALLGAAKGGYRVAVAESPGSDMWEGNTALQQALSQAVQSINVPVFLVQPDHDVTVDPSYTLGQEFLKLNKAYSIEVVPPYGTQAEQGQCFGGASGYHWWAEDVLTFIHEAFAPSDSIVDTSVAQPNLQGILKRRISLQSDGLTLEGFEYKPQGQGPFPGVIWNHGSEQDPAGRAEFDKLAELLVPHGYVLVTPVRRGHSESQGTYISDAVQAVAKAQGKQAAAQELVKLMTTEQLDDQLAGFKYLKALPYVDPSRLVDIGCSYGGIQTIFGAEANPGYKAAVAVSPGAESWNGNKPLEDRLTQAMGNMQIPIFIIQPAKDASLGPTFALGPALFAAGKDHGLKLFPPFGPEEQQGHCFGGALTQIWGQTVLNFFNYELQQ